jgi:hypothetical protein
MCSMIADRKTSKYLSINICFLDSTAQVDNYITMTAFIKELEACVLTQIIAIDCQ